MTLKHTPTRLTLYKGSRKPRPGLHHYLLYINPNEKKPAAYTPTSTPEEVRTTREFSDLKCFHTFNYDVAILIVINMYGEVLDRHLTGVVNIGLRGCRCGV